MGLQIHMLLKLTKLLKQPNMLEVAVCVYENTKNYLESGKITMSVSQRKVPTTSSLFLWQNIKILHFDC